MSVPLFSQKEEALGGGSDVKARKEASVEEAWAEKATPGIRSVWPPRVKAGGSRRDQVLERDSL